MIVTFKEQFRKPIENGTKKHTIRKNEDGDYKPGVILRLWIEKIKDGDTQSDVVKTTKCTGIQKIEIRYGNGGYSDVFVYQDVRVLVDGRELSYPEVTELAKNDGFDNQDDFFRWFNKDCKRSIIHWENILY